MGDIDDPLTFREFWNVTTRVDEFGNAERVRANRGPIFSRHGSTKPDWDPHTRIPVFVMTLDDSYRYPDGSVLQPDDVFSGKFIVAIRHGLKPIVKRVQDSGRSFARDLDNHAESLGREMGDFLWYEANKTGQTRDTSVTRDQASAAMKTMEKRDRWRKGFEDLYVPPSPRL